MNGLSISPDEQKSSKTKTDEYEKKSCSCIRRGTFPFFLSLSSFWFGFAALLTSAASVIWPSQCQALIGKHRKDLYLGVLTAATSGVTFIGTPIVGTISDHFSSKYGRRRPIMLLGLVVAIVFLLWASRIKAGTPFWQFLLISLAWSCGATVANSPFIALMPDVTPEDKRGIASSFLTLMMACGALTGGLSAGLLARPNDYTKVYPLICLLLIVFALPTFLFIREEPLDPNHPPLRMSEFFSSFMAQGPQYRDLWIVTHSRFWFDMGVCGLLPYLQYFFTDMLNIPTAGGQAEQYSAGVVVAVVAFSIPSAICGGALSDRFSKKSLLYVACVIMTLPMVALIVSSLLSPAVWIVLSAGSIFGTGYGLFLAVDWSLATSVLPKASQAGKDMGVFFSVGNILPQVFSPLISGFILSEMKERDLISMAYLILFSLEILYFFLAAIILVPVRENSKNQLDPSLLPIESQYSHIRSAVSSDEAIVL